MNKILVLYNFQYEESNVSAPNFYFESFKDLALSGEISVKYIPPAPDFLKYIKSKKCKSYLYLIYISGWLFVNINKFDYAFGWLTYSWFGAVISVLGLGRKKCKVVSVCYGLPGVRSKGLKGIISNIIVKWIFKSAYSVVTLDKKQAQDWSLENIGSRDDFKSLLYGVDYSFYKTWASNKSFKTANLDPYKKNIFVPGSAARNESDLYKLAYEFDGICFLRFQIDSNRYGASFEIESVGNSYIYRFYNQEYDVYLNYMSGSNFVFIPVENLDKPVGLTSALEAMSLGKAVLMPFGTSSIDYLDSPHAGLTYSHGNYQDVRKAFDFLLSNEDECNKIGLNAKNRVVKVLDKNISSANIMRFFV